MPRYAVSRIGRVHRISEKSHTSGCGKASKELCEELTTRTVANRLDADPDILCLACFPTVPSEVRDEQRRTAERHKGK